MAPPGYPSLRWLLAPPGLLYGSAVILRNRLYQRGLLAPRRVGIPVVSVGNLAAGGSGKTPFVAYLAGRLREAGRRVAVASRGYGGRRHDVPITVSAGEGSLAAADEVGDEPVLLSDLLPGIVVVVCRDRAAAAVFAKQRFDSDLVILDDGFQHRKVQRDLDLLLLDAVEGVGNGRMMPFGPLREPLEEMRRADALVVTGAAEDLPAGAERVRREADRLDLEIPLFLCERRVEGFLRAETEELVPAAALKGLRILAFSGIARPHSFESDLRASGLNVARAIRFRDHQRFGAPQLERLRTAAKEAGADLIVTTEKDRVRLGTARLGAPLYAQRIRMIPRNEEDLWKFISGRLLPSRELAPPSGA